MRRPRRLPELHVWILAFLTLGAFLFLVGPIAVIALGSLEAKHSYYIRIPPRDPTLDWYFRIPAKYLSAFGTSLLVATTSALVATALGSMAALALVRGNVRAKPVLESFFRVPLQIPAVVTGVAFLIFYNYLAVWSGLDLLGSLAGIMAAHVFITIPYAASSVAIVLAQMNPHLEEAAETLGASRWSTFRRVTLPVIKPGIFTGFFYGFVVSFGDVPVTVFLASGTGAMTLPVEIFDSMQFDFDPSILAVSVLVVGVCAALVLLVQRWVGLDLVLPSGRR